jgi:hypothetical protein
MLLIVLAVGAAVGCGATNDDRDPTWSYISPAIIQPNCATSSCHSQGSAVAGLNLSTVDAGYRSLLQLHLPLRGMIGAPKTRQLVTPGNPDESRVVNMMRAVGSWRMPPDRPLAEGDIVLIERWILNGAQKD